MLSMSTSELCYFLMLRAMSDCAPNPYYCGMMLLYISPVLCHSMRGREGGRERRRKEGRDSFRERIDGLTMNTVKK